MNNNLFGRSILVGRDEKHGSLGLYLTLDNKPYYISLGQPGSVPNSVSRCIPGSGRAHLRIDIDPSGHMQLSNLNPQNITCVDGYEIMKKHINPNSHITLGSSAWPLPLANVLDTAANVVSTVGKSAPKAYTVAHLKDVWHNYTLRNEKMDKKQSIYAFLRGIPMIVAPIGGLLSAYFVANGRTSPFLISLTVTLVTVPIVLYSSLKMMKQPEEKKQNLNNLKKNYVCPNPDCRRRLTNFEYEELLKMKKCPYCGCTFK